MNDELDKLLKALRKQAMILDVTTNIALINVEKEIDKLHKRSKRLSLILNFLSVGIMVISIAGWLGINFPNPFLNSWTLEAAKMATLWSILFTLMKIIENWKMGRESNRAYQENMEMRDERRRAVEYNKLLQRKAELKKEKMVN